MVTNTKMSSLVFPFHDPNNIETKFLEQVLPLLKENFDHAFVSITPKTITGNPEAVEFFESDNFFVLNRNTDDSQIGDHIVASYRNALEHASPDQILHLCYSDRIAFALSNYKDMFLSDIKSISTDNSPVLFLRSPKAWLTHPTNYHAAESMVTEAGKVLFGKTLDFAWCHLTLSAEQLATLSLNLTARDLVVVAQLIFHLRDSVSTKEVDWLSWEDPFILGKDPQRYKLERETDPVELEKRMNYVLPQIKYLFEEYRKLI